MEFKHALTSTMKHVIARPRVHIGLADMGNASPRSFGGVGFSLDCEPTIIEFEKCQTVKIVGTEALDTRAQHEIFALTERLKSVRQGIGFNATIRSVPKQHVGLGSKTSLALSIIAGANAINELGFSSDEMQRLSGRGAASGVGLHAFFQGGIVWDVGHRFSPGMRLLPSSTKIATDIPPLLARLAFPTVWQIALLLPDEPTMSGDDEATFFSENAPVPKEEALETMAILYHGVLPSFALSDYNTLCSSLRSLHQVGFKMREVQRCSARTQSCLRTLFDHGLAAGMSSVGPLLYIILPCSDRERLGCVRSVSSDFGVPILSVASGWNAGYELRAGAWR
ncbi:beta-ribofuranosylaminobenzene 5'-phosphate synthase family protein [Bradyrhizobium sp. CCBAU 65884]|uniref:beta-ribofuranosylaminobenzene 5'-phosphate synthase family protein n=1 Tax=Bradyrhizobium sp. CCBAU 65884 TaxID=722477 RepID=UPI0023055EF5|nr:beta-ribofuranosylaminobenzene 5'-phosphate synthase family protein [Bradyrhizobium sp. CCBAU 65884]